MPIAFTPDRWDKVRQTYRLWWQGELDRLADRVDRLLDAGRRVAQPHEVEPGQGGRQGHRHGEGEAPGVGVVR